MEKKTEKSVFETLVAINCNEHVEKKNGLSYLAWAWAWQIVKQNFPSATYTIYENSNGLFYHTDGKTCWVKTGVTIDGIEMIEYLPVMDFRNQSIPLERVTSFDVNKTIQRSLTKACARHGLGLYIYAGEDLPEGESEPAKPKSGNEPAKQKVTAAQLLAPKKMTKKQEAWGLFKKGHEDIPADQLKDKFKNFCMDICECDVQNLSDSDFDKVIDAIKAL